MNIVFCAYAHKENFQTGHNVQGKDTQDVYLKNSFVALNSCKHFNKEVEVALITNLRLSEYWTKLFKENDIKIFRCLMTPLFLKKIMVGVWHFINYVL